MSGDKPGQQTRAALSAYYAYYSAGGSESKEKGKAVSRKQETHLRLYRD